MAFTRRHVLALIPTLPLAAGTATAFAQEREIWSARQAHQGLLDDTLRLLDIRSRGEWRETGVALGAWPVSMHEKGFPTRLMAARDLAGERPVALICATGGRSRAVLQALNRAGYAGFVDVSEGMLGSRAGPGWIAAGLPVVTLDEALVSLPRVLA